MQNNSDSRSRFSWHRVAEVAAFYAPTTNRLLLVYFLFSLLFAVVTLLPLPEYAQVGLFSLNWTAIPLMFELAPIALAKNGDSRIIERLIPATPTEKFVYYLLFFTIVVGAAIYLLPWLALNLYEFIPSVHSPMASKIFEMKLSNPWMLEIANGLTVIATCYTCLYVVFKARTGRVVKGVIAVFVMQIVIGMIGAITGFTVAFSQGYTDGVNGVPANPEEVSRNVVDQMSSTPYLSIMIAVAAVYIVGVLCLFYRNLRARIIKKC